MKIAQQAGYLTKLTPLIKAIEPTLSLNQSLGFLSSLYEGIRDLAVTKQSNAKLADTQTIMSVVEYFQKNPFEFKQAYLVHRGVENIENLSEEMQDRFWNAYADVNFRKIRPVLAELGTKTPMEVIAFVLKFPKPKKKKSVFKKAYKFLGKTSVALAVLTYALQIYDRYKQQNTEFPIPQQVQEQSFEQDITALLHECQGMSSTSESVHQKSDLKQTQRHQDDRDL